LGNGSYIVSYFVVDDDDNVKAKVIPVIIGVTGTISRSFRKYLRNIPGKHESKEVQK
jgi:RNase P/RNase MRP subunit POP5